MSGVEGFEVVGVNREQSSGANPHDEPIEAVVARNRAEHKAWIAARKAMEKPEEATLTAAGVKFSMPAETKPQPRIEATPTAAPTPVEDLERRLVALERARVRRYEDHGLIITFDGFRGA